MAPVGNGQTVIKEGKSNDFIWGCVADSGDGGGLSRKGRLDG